MKMNQIIEQAMAWSTYLQRRLNFQPNLSTQLQQDCQISLNASVLNTWLEEISGKSPEVVMEVEECKRVLRQLRQRVFATLIIRDMAKTADFTEVTSTMSALADLAIQKAYQTIYEQLIQIHGIPTHTNGQAMHLIILGMGKLGGQELNVSSDIDLIMLYANEGETTGRRPISYHEFFSKLTQRMMPIISEQTADGMVFRTDLRLRPDGDAGPLAWSLEALENYLITQGREWERYAWLKARIIPVGVPNPKDYQDLENIRRPFVYRKYLDFNTLPALRRLRGMIRDDWTRKVNHRAGIDYNHNIKLGEGGIREIEFIIQVQQLIRGGRQTALRISRLLDALDAEEKIGILTPEQAEKLKNAYYFLRRVEHFLQYKDDAQTHLLPSQDEDLAQLAKVMSYDLDTFKHLLDTHRQYVSTQFKDIFHTEQTEELEANDQLAQIKSSLNHYFRHEADRDEVLERIESFMNSAKIRPLSETQRMRLLALMPNMIEASAQTEHPRSAYLNFLTLLEAIASRSAYIALLIEYPEVVKRLAQMLASSPSTAQFLSQNPILLDSVIDWHSLMQDIQFDHIKAQIQQDLNRAILPNGKADIEQQMNIMRDYQKQIRFQLFAQDLGQKLSVEKLADELSALADMFLQLSIPIVWEQLRQSKYPDAPETPKFAIIAYGRLGGKELGYNSDLDLVMLFDDTRPQALEQYTFLARRLITWFSTLTPSGRLYDIDLRLRPDGDAGLLVVSVDTFKTYQEQHAWIWEHQALSRARFCAGDSEIGKKFEQIRQNILSQTRTLTHLQAEVLSMRDKITQGHPNSSHLFDIKHDRGGMVDIEFMVQYLILAYAHQYPNLLQNLGNIALLRMAGEHGLIPMELAMNCANAYRTFRARQHACRLQGQDKARISPDELQFEREQVQALWQYLFSN